MANRNITIKQDSTLKTVKGSTFEERTISLMIDNKLFDPNIEDEDQRNIQKRIHGRYWDNIKKHCLKDSRIVVKLSGIHFTIKEFIDKIHKYQDYDDLNYTFQRYDWQIKGDGTREVESFGVIECDMKLFKIIFDYYWFALAFELRCLAFVIPAENKYDIFRWGRRIESTKNENDLISRSMAVFDNCYNRFHYKLLIRNRKDELL